MPKVPARRPSEPDTSKLPRRVTRHSAAELVSQFYFAVSPRTIEKWPLRVRHLNGKVMLETAELFDYARRCVDAAPPIKGGRSRVQRQAT